MHAAKPLKTPRTASGLAHGESLRGGIKDLRPDDRARNPCGKPFFDIVLGGKRQAKGMAYVPSWRDPRASGRRA